MDKQKYYLTTTLPYVNGEPHIGFAKEIINADVIARYRRQQGKEVFFNTGTDEHGLKIYQKAGELGITAQEYCDRLAESFKALRPDLNLSYDNFIRTTDSYHAVAAQAFWKKCEEAGDIYKKNYKVKYCVGCELEKSDSDLEDGVCPLHPNRPLEIIEEENYFFRFSKYQDQLLAFYDRQPDFVRPQHRLKEIRNFVAAGLQDFSISRLKSKMPWGVPVPGDEDQVMYVWFDALVNYISCLGWPADEKRFRSFWPGLQVCGKDNLRQQAAMWQAMLMSAGLPNSTQVLVFGFLTLNGKKISKSAGNSVDPLEMAAKYGIDTLRYFLLSDVPTFEDGDFSEEKLRGKYNADLANGLGNLAARVGNLLEKEAIVTTWKLDYADEMSAWEKEYHSLMEKYDFNAVLSFIWSKIAECNEELTVAAPWKMEDREAARQVLSSLAKRILHIADLLLPFIPESAQKIKENFSATQAKKGEALFPRII